MSNEFSSINGNSTKADAGGSMNDLAGLLALMQNNKGMDVPGLLALCKDKGYGDGAFGGGGSFMVIFLILLLFTNGGFSGLGGGGQAAFNSLAGGSAQDILDIYAKIDSGNTATNNLVNSRFDNLNTNFVEGMARLLTAVRDQGDRVISATTSISEQMARCCADMRAAFADLRCEIRDLKSEIALAQERTLRHMDDKFCHLNHRLDQQEARAETEKWRDRAIAAEDRLRDNGLANRIETYMEANYKSTT